MKDGFSPGPAPDAIQVTNEPFCVVRLAEVPHVWESIDSTEAILHPAATVRCDYFMSHVRSDQHEMQAMPMVTGFLFVHPFLSHVTAVLMTIGMFMIPLGAAIAIEVPSIPFWLLSVLVGVLLMIIWTWVLLAMHTSVVPQWMRPWALSQRTLWIDKYCMNHNSLSGMCSIGYCIAQSSNLIAVINDDYFTNLRCMFEIAIFCKLHKGSKLQEKLVLISSEWQGIWWPHKSISLTSREIKWLADFRCDKARCAIPAERQIIIRAICEVWGSLADFEYFIHSELLYVLAESKQLYYQQPKIIIGEALSHVFAS